MPPTGKKRVPSGNTLRIARNTVGGSSSAGNSFSPSAPLASAANPSLGVAMPGMLTSPDVFVARITCVSTCGVTINLPPASATSYTSAAFITVPAPISTSSPKA